MSPITILDGPVGTELHARAVPTPLPLWSAGAIDSAPDVLGAIHRDYAQAGARVHTTNTFRTKRRQAGDEWERLTIRAVEICRAAIPAEHLVAGSISPLEDCYRPALSPARAECAREHAEMARCLAGAGVDLILCETFPSADEGLIACEQALETGLPVWLSLTAGPDADLLSETDLARSLARGARAGASAVLVNCVPASRTTGFVRAIAAAGIGVPFGAYANAGHADEYVGWASDHDLGAGRYAEFAREWADAGATIIGGCCGTGVAHTTACARAFSET